jgi:hypothetical protein
MQGAPSGQPIGAPQRRVSLRVLALHRGQAGFVTGFLVRTFLVFALVGLAVEEAGQIVVTQIHASKAAGTAAQAGADEWVVTHNVDLAERAAVDAMAKEDSSAKMTAFSVADDGTVTVTAEEEATTLVVRRVSFLKKLGVQHATEHEIHSLA